MRRRWMSEPSVDKGQGEELEKTEWKDEDKMNNNTLLVSNVDESCCSCGCGSLLDNDVGVEALSTSSGVESGRSSDTGTLMRTNTIVTKDNKENSNDENRVTIFIPFESPGKCDVGASQIVHETGGGQRVVLRLQVPVADDPVVHGHHVDVLLEEEKQEMSVKERDGSKVPQRRRLRRRMARRMTTAITRRSLDSVLAMANDQDAVDNIDDHIESENRQLEVRDAEESNNSSVAVVDQNELPEHSSEECGSSGATSEKKSSEEKQLEEKQLEEKESEEKESEEKESDNKEKECSSSMDSFLLGARRRKDLSKWLGVDMSEEKSEVRPPTRSTTSTRSTMTTSKGLSVPVVRWARKLTISNSSSSLTTITPSRSNELCSYRDLDELRHENVRQVLRLGRGQLQGGAGEVREHRKDLHRFLGLDDSDSDEMVFIQNQKNSKPTRLKPTDADNNNNNVDITKKNSDIKMDENGCPTVMRDDASSSSLSSLDEAAARTPLDSFLKMHLINSGDRIEERERVQSTPDISTTTSPSSLSLSTGTSTTMTTSTATTSSATMTSNSNRSSSSEELKSSLMSPELRTARSKKTVIFSEDLSIKEESVGGRRRGFWARGDRRRSKKEAERRSAELLLQPDHQRRGGRQLKMANGNQMYVVDPSLLLVPPQDTLGALTTPPLFLTCDTRGRVRLVTPSATLAAVAGAQSR